MWQAVRAPAWSGTYMYDSYKVCAIIDLVWCASQKCQTTWLGSDGSDRFRVFSGYTNLTAEY